MLLTRLPICSTQSLRVKVLEGVMSCIYYDPTATIAVLNTSTFLSIFIILYKNDFSSSTFHSFIHPCTNSFPYSFIHTYIHFLTSIFFY